MPGDDAVTGAIDSTVIDLRDVRVAFGGSLFRPGQTVHALDGVSLGVERGERHGLVGESGSGKTTLGRVILGLQGATGGRVRVAGSDPATLSATSRRAFRRRVQTVFQDSAASLNPRLTIGQSVREGLDIHGIADRRDRAEMVVAMLRRVGLDADYAARFPHELSGGQRQRVNIARSLVIEPEILVADEPVSALDVSIQAQILDLLAALHAEMNLTLVFISHDLHVVREICDTVSVMQGGRIVEAGPTQRIFGAPEHAYSKLLLAAV